MVHVSVDISLITKHILDHDNIILIEISAFKHMKVKIQILDIIFNTFLLIGYEQ